MRREARRVALGLVTSALVAGSVWAGTAHAHEDHTLGDAVSIDDVAKAHQADLAHQGGHGVNYLRYWVNEPQGQIFCLVEAPDAEAAATVHREAHGLVADQIFQVQEGV